MARKIRPLTLALATAAFVVVVNWILGPRLYPSYSIAVSAVIITILVACLLIFGTTDSIRTRLRQRRRKKAAP